VKTSILLSVGLIGCSTVQTIGRPATPLDLQRIAAEGDGHPVEVKLAPDRRIRVEGLHAVGGRLNWNGPVAGSASSEDLREATVVRRGKGLFEGLAIGAAAGLATALVIGVIGNSTCSAGPLIDGEHPQNTCLLNGPGLLDGLALGAVLGILVMPLGAVIGGVAGELRGDRTTFTNEPRH
jgi:hypothetical protein